LAVTCRCVIMGPDGHTKRLRDPRQMIELEVYSVLYSLLSRHRVVLLKEAHGDRFLPIWIGQHESEAIAMHLQGASAPRPLTHDLLTSAIGQLGGRLDYVLVNDLANGTFFARLAITHAGGLTLIDSRPSDAIALAVRANAPIYAEPEVLLKAGILPSPDIRAQREDGPDGLDVFRDFVDTLDLDETETEE
jgi:bifunctional DNase/RNase